MPSSYVIYNPDGSVNNCIYCEDQDPIPEGCTKVKVPVGHIFDGEKIKSIDQVPVINLETV
jgi:hypothetical protein